MAKDFLLNVRKNKDGQFYGKVHDLLPDEMHSFIGMDKAILLMEETMNQKLRDFGRKGEKVRQETAKIPEVRNGQKARFHVRVLFREKNTWQGEVTWVEAGEKKYFRSVLELLNMIDSAFDEKP